MQAINILPDQMRAEEETIHYGVSWVVHHNAVIRVVC